MYFLIIVKRIATILLALIMKRTRTFEAVKAITGRRILPSSYVKRIFVEALVSNEILFRSKSTKAHLLPLSSHFHDSHFL